MLNSTSWKQGQIAFATFFSKRATPRHGENTRCFSVAPISSCSTRHGSIRVNNLEFLNCPLHRSSSSSSRRRRRRRRRGSSRRRRRRRRHYQVRKIRRSC